MRGSTEKPVIERQDLTAKGMVVLTWPKTGVDARYSEVRLRDRLPSEPGWIRRTPQTGSAVVSDATAVLSSSPMARREEEVEQLVVVGQAAGGLSVSPGANVGVFAVGRALGDGPDQVGEEALGVEVFGWLVERCDVRGVGGVVPVGDRGA